MASIRKRNNHYHIDYYDEAGKRHRVALGIKATKENYKLAVIELKKIEYELSAGIHLEKLTRLEKWNKTLSEGYAEFIETKNSKSEKTKEHLEDSYQKFLIHIGDMRIKNITAKHFDELEIELKNKKKPLTNNSIASYFNKLHQIFSYFKVQGYIENNPVPIKKMKPKEIVTIPEKELQDILGLLKTKSREHYQVIFLLLATGMRSGELTRLEWKDIDLKNNIIAVKNTKADRVDFIPIYSELRNFLLEEFEKREGKVVNYANKDSLKFFKRFLEREGFNHYSIHTLRKTYISRLVNSGLSVYDVMTLARHKSIQTTLKHYTAAELSRIDKEVSDKANMGTFLGTKIQKPLKVVNSD